MTYFSEEDWDISYCGLNCAKCDIFLASHGNEELHKNLIKWFKESIDPNIESINCEGCRGPTNKCWSNDCEFRPCAMEKGFDYCFECSDFICDKLEKFANDGHDHHKRTVENLKMMKRLGLEEWKSSQKEVIFCP